MEHQKSVPSWKAGKYESRDEQDESITLRFKLSEMAKQWDSNHHDPDSLLFGKQRSHHYNGVGVILDAELSQVVSNFVPLSDYTDDTYKCYTIKHKFNTYCRENND